MSSDAGKKHGGRRRGPLIDVMGFPGAAAALPAGVHDWRMAIALLVHCTGPRATDSPRPSWRIAALLVRSCGAWCAPADGSGSLYSSTPPPTAEGNRPRPRCHPRMDTGEARATTLTREELYEMVGTEPMQTLAATSLRVDSSLCISRLIMRSTHAWRRSMRDKAQSAPRKNDGHCSQIGDCMGPYLPRTPNSFGTNCVRASSVPCGAILGAHARRSIRSRTLPASRHACARVPPPDPRTQPH